MKSVPTGLGGPFDLGLGLFGHFDDAGLAGGSSATATVVISHINRLTMSMMIAPTTSNGRPAAADVVAMGPSAHHAAAVHLDDSVDVTVALEVTTLRRTTSHGAGRLHTGQEVEG